MNRTSNWSRLFLSEHAASGYGEDAPWKKTEVADAVPFQAASTIDWSSVLLPLHTDYFESFCSSPEPDTNSGMLLFTHDHAALTGTA
jgi:hypothetical protein